MCRVYCSTWMQSDIKCTMLNTIIGHRPASEGVRAFLLAWFTPMCYVVQHRNDSIITSFSLRFNLGLLKIELQ